MRACGSIKGQGEMLDCDIVCIAACRPAKKSIDYLKNIKIKHSHSDFTSSKMLGLWTSMQELRLISMLCKDKVGLYMKLA